MANQTVFPDSSLNSYFTGQDFLGSDDQILKDSPATGSTSPAHYVKEGSILQSHSTYWKNKVVQSGRFNDWFDVTFGAFSIIPTGCKSRIVFNAENTPLIQLIVSGVLYFKKSVNVGLATDVIFSSGNNIILDVGSSGVKNSTFNIIEANRPSFPSNGYLSLSGLIINQAAGQTITYTTVGAHSFLVPNDVSTITVECIGGGSNGDDSINSEEGVSGGGGGAYSKKINYIVVGGTSYDLYVGDVEEDTWFNTPSIVFAEGANGGGGGDSANCIGDVKFSGGNGDGSQQEVECGTEEDPRPRSISGGDGGAGANLFGAGANGGGGAGGISQNNGSNGINYGDGGGGAGGGGCDVTDQSYFGGSGVPGVVSITYTSRYVTGADNVVKIVDLDLFLDGYSIADINSSGTLYTKGYARSSGNCDLYIGGTQAVVYSGNCDLYTKGYARSSGNCDLYIGGTQVVTSSGNCDLYIKGTQVVAATGNCDLYIRGYTFASGNCNLYIPGTTPVASTGNLDLYIKGYDDFSSNCDLFIHGYTRASGNCNLFIQGNITNTGEYLATSTLHTISYITVSDTSTLYTHGIISVSGNCNLYTGGMISVSGNISLYTGGMVTVSGNIPLYISGVPPVCSGNIPLFMTGIGTSSGNLDLYMLCDYPTRNGAPIPPILPSILSVLTDEHRMQRVPAPVRPIFLFDSGCFLYIGGHAVSTSGVELFMKARDYEIDYNRHLIPPFLPSIMSLLIDEHPYRRILGSGDDAVFFNTFPTGLYLHTWGHLPVSSDFPLFVHCEYGVSGNFDLFTAGLITPSGGFDLFCKAIEPFSSSLTLFMRGFPGSSGSDIMPLYALGPPSISRTSSMNLVAYQDTEPDENITLFVYNNYVESTGATPLFMKAPSGTLGAIPAYNQTELFIEGYSSRVASGISLYTGGLSVINSGSFDLFTDGTVYATDTVNLYTDSKHTFSSGLRLYSHGK